MHYLNKCKPVDDYLVLEYTNKDEVYKHITKLKNNSSSGPIDVPNQFLKLIATPLANVMCCIINRSMYSGYVLNQMKIGKQTPVHKGGEVCISNYRPITVCSNLSKILEKVVRTRVVEYIKRVNILNKCQFGFRNKHSTNHAIINLTEASLDALDDGLKVGGVFLDVAKAFDTINHDILIRKLEYYGFRGATLMWFESYLKNRQQYVSIRKQNSDMYKLDWGIPQGGILAPILFIIFMNDITKSSNIFDFSIYADDTCLILGIKSTIYQETMKKELRKVVEWFSSNELLLNFGKTDYLHFGPHHNKVYEKGEFDLTELHLTAPHYICEDEWAEPDDPDHIEVNNKGEFVMQELHKVCPAYFLTEFIEMPDETIICEPESVKYLGVLLDNRLNFKNHVGVLCCKLNRIVGILWRNDHLTIEAKKMVYNGLVESHLNYGIVTWASSFGKNISSTHIDELIPVNLTEIVKTQNKILRAIFRKPKYDRKNQIHTSVTPLYKELRVLKLSDLYYSNLASLAHDFVYNNSLPEKIADKYHRRQDITTVITRGTECNLYYRTPKLNSTTRQPSIAAAAYWNQLPYDLKVINSKKIFKERLKNYLIDKY